MDEIEEQTDSNKQCLLQWRIGKWLRPELSIKSFFSSSYETLFFCCAKDRKNLDRSDFFL